MNLFKTAAIIALASAGLMAQDTASYVQRYQAVQPELERLIIAMEYAEAINRVEAILPVVTPPFQKDPEDPGVGIVSFQELDAIQSLHVYLGRAAVMGGDMEKALDNFRKAEEIAKLNAIEIEGVLSPLVEMWSEAIPTLEQLIQETEQMVEAVEPLRGQKAELEGKRRRNRAENERLAQIDSTLAQVDERVSAVPQWQAELERAPLLVQQFNETIAVSKEDSTKFRSAIESMQEDLDAENELINDKFAGDKVRYVDSVINTEENLARIANVADKVKFLNRLRHLDPQNQTVQQELAKLLTN